MSEPELPVQGLFGDRWQKALAAAGVAIVVAAVAVRYQPVIFIGLGVMLVGFGEWANRPIGSGISHSGIHRIGFMWKPSVPGVALDLVGATLFAIGVDHACVP